jgi:Domain of unknown function (DUF222)
VELSLVFERLRGCDFASCDSPALALALADARVLTGWLDGVYAAAAARAEALRQCGNGREAETVLQRSGGLSARDARQASVRAEALDQVPAFAAAIAHGSVTGAHVDSLARAVDRAPAVADHADDLARLAAQTSPHEFEQHCKRLAAVLEPNDGLDAFERQRRATRLRRWIDQATGMYRVNGEFDPEFGERLFRSIDRTVEARFHDRHPDTAPTDPGERNDHLAALALVECATTGGSPGRGTAQPEIAVLIDLETLRNGRHADSTVQMSTGGQVPVEVVRKWACDAGIIPVVFNGDGVVLDVGRAKRLATADQRRALRAMYPTCSAPGCTVNFSHTTIHHVDYWTRDGGGTDLYAQVPVCSRHHDAVHHGGWTVRALKPGRLEWRLPDGTTEHTSSVLDRRKRPA